MVTMTALVAGLIATGHSPQNRHSVLFISPGICLDKHPVL